MLGQHRQHHIDRHPSGMAPEQEPMQADRRDEKAGRNDGRAQGDQIDDLLELRQLLEPALERQGQQETREQLDAGLDDPQFL